MSEEKERPSLKNIADNYVSNIERYVSNLREINTMMQEMQKFESVIPEKEFKEKKHVLLAKTAVHANEMLASILKESAQTLDGMYMTQMLYSNVNIANCEKEVIKTTVDIKEAIPIFIHGLDILDTEAYILHKELKISNVALNAVVALKEEFNMLYISNTSLTIQLDL